MSTNTVLLKPIGSGDALSVDRDLLIGRSEECDVVLREGHLSRAHARISLREGAPWLEDLGSTNGTFVNEQRIAEAVKLKHGDRVRFDVVEFDVVVQSARSDVTQVRSTMVRAPADAPPKPAVQAPADAAPKPSAPEAKPKPRAAEPAKPPVEPAVAEDSGTMKRPGAWADPTFKLEGKTEFLTPEQLARMQKEIEPPDLGADMELPYLQVVSGKSAGKSLQLEGQEQTSIWTVGSDSTRNIVFDDPGVSSYHARLVNDGRRWKVIDQMSQNGTYVNGVKATTSFLSSGDRLKFGPVECFFRLPHASKPASARRTSWLLALVSFVATIAVLLLLLRWLGI